jgi:hypothetical protein
VDDDAPSDQGVMVSEANEARFVKELTVKELKTTEARL